MGYVKAILVIGIILVSGYYYHEYEDKHKCMEIWRGLLWFGLAMAAVAIVTFCIPS